MADIISANVHDLVATDTFPHSEEETACGDSAYGNKQRSLEAKCKEDDVVWAIPFKLRKDQWLTDEKRQFSQ